MLSNSSTQTTRRHDATEAQALLQQLTIAGSELAKALAEEKRLASQRCGREEGDHIYREWIQARQRVEEFRAVYFSVVEACGG